ncbi:Transcription elongation factor 1-like protein [Colletotrichum sidae]|uniref:Transcription elongation factor 1 homolog n=2 Tax=Colletotrichum orbiculare species complex TaxID=2707354 RepID=A0A4R8PUT7_9PEZI|nr:Transcription elongation factor 1-like protein [Colletotrichum spinosum]TDZ48345.1 Transcription elongation factor 1-like protein [Colletotrichum sidae]
MGKRKSSKKPQGPKRADPLPTKFTCLFCNHEDSVVVKLDKKAGVGSLDCRVCGQMFQCSINYLSAAVDVYGEWVDAADAVAKDSGSKAASSPGKTPNARRVPPARLVNDDDDDGGGVSGVDGDDY